MLKFLKYYALEIYTVLSLLLLLIGGLLDNLSVIQKFVLVYVFLFILHEWEEFKYPGGFAELIGGMLGLEINEELKRASRIPTSILLLAFTIIPFIWDTQVVAVLVVAALGVLEGIVHILAIRLFRLAKFYSPGLVTAELELLTSGVLVGYLAKNNLASGFDYILGFGVMLLCFVLMQKSLTMMVGIPYLEVPKKVRQQWKQKIGQ